ncbi:MAG: tetratricopeptide repeat protein [Bacteroidota bacterium]
MNTLAILNTLEQTNEYFEHLFFQLVHHKIKEEKVTESLKLPAIDEFLDSRKEELRVKNHFLDENRQNFINYTNYLLLKAIVSYVQNSRDDALKYIRQARQLEAENPFWVFMDAILRSDFEVDSFNLSTIEDIQLIRQNPYADKIISFIGKCQQLEKNVSPEKLIKILFDLQKETDPKFIKVSSTLVTIASTNRNSAFNEIPDIISSELANNDQVKAIINRGIQSNSDNEPLWHIFNAWLNLHNENYYQAKRIFQGIKNETDEISNFDPTIHWACIGLYKVYVNMGDEYSAMKALEEYLSLIHLFEDMETFATDPEFPALSPEQANIILHDYYTREKDYSSALHRVLEIKNYHYRLDANLNYATILTMLADTLYLLESYDEALYHYYRCLDLDPYNEKVQKRIKELSCHKKTSRNRSDKGSISYFDF